LKRRRWRRRSIRIVFVHNGRHEVHEIIVVFELVIVTIIVVVVFKLDVGAVSILVCSRPQCVGGRGRFGDGGVFPD